MKTQITIAQTREDAVIPSKTNENMGFDVYPCFDEDYMIIPPQTVSLVPTGIAIACDKQYGIFAKERGSTGLKGMAIRAGVVDSGYRGEIFIEINNTTNKSIIITKEYDSIESLNADYTVYPYKKAIAQLVVLPVPEVDVKIDTYENLKKIPSGRGIGCLGSSDK